MKSKINPKMPRPTVAATIPITAKLNNNPLIPPPIAPTAPPGQIFFERPRIAANHGKMKKTKMNKIFAKLSNEFELSILKFVKLSPAIARIIPSTPIVIPSSKFSFLNCGVITLSIISFDSISVSAPSSWLPVAMKSSRSPIATTSSAPLLTSFFPTFHALPSSVANCQIGISSVEFTITTAISVPVFAS
ncbi:hypothetical protein KAI54_02140 [Candidatus Gracilibacteria bacterium]|nr:hypothetical protein [Candidatus Gracilibacteria bacterium]